MSLSLIRQYRSLSVDLCMLLFVVSTVVSLLVYVCLSVVSTVVSLLLYVLSLRPQCHSLAGVCMSVCLCVVSTVFCLLPVCLAVC